MSKDSNTEVLSLNDIDERKKEEQKKIRELEEKISKQKLKEIEREAEKQKKLTNSVRTMQKEIKESNDILFSLLKVSILFLVAVIVIILIKRTIG